MRVAIAAALWLPALGLTVVLREHLQRANFALFWISVLFAAWYAGFAAAIALAALSVVAVEYLVVAPTNGEGPFTAQSALTLAIFVAASGLVSALAASRARAQRIADAYALQLEEQAVELETQMEEAQSLTEDLGQANARLESALAAAEHARREALDASTRAGSILDTLVDAVVSYDAEWRLVYANPTARATLRALGVDVERALGRVIWELLPQLRGTPMEVAVRHAAAARRVVDRDEYQRDLDRWFESRIVPGADGGVTIYSRDVSDRQRALAGERAAADRARRLLAVTSGLSEAVTEADVADAIMREGLSAVGADAGSLVLVRRGEGADPASLDGATGEIVRVHGYAPQVVEAFRRFTLRAGRPLSDALLTGVPVLLESRDDWKAHYPATTFDHRDAGYEAFAAIPIMSGRRVLAAINASFRERVTFDDATRTFLATIGEQGGLALARAEAFEAERRARAFVAATLASVQDGFVALDAEFRFRYVNARVEALIRRPASEVLGRVLWDVFPEVESTPFADALRRVRATRAPETFDGVAPVARRWLDVRVYPADDGGVTVFIQDVSDQRRAQQASAFLAEASRLLTASLDYEATLRAVAEAAVPALGDWCAVDMVRDPLHGTWPPELDRLAVVHQDPAKVALVAELNARFPIDWSRAPQLTAVLRDRTPILIPEVTDDMLVAGAANGEHLAALRALGIASFIAVPLVARDTTLGTLTLVVSESDRRYDATDLALAQDLAQRAAAAVDNARLFRDAEQARHEAEAANRAKSQFLSTMSHELRTPLNAITGYTQLLELGLRGPVTDEQREDLSRIRRSANVLMSLVTDVLNFARIEVGRVDLDLRAVALDAVLAGLEALVAPQLRAKRLTYRFASCGGAVHVRADAERLQQVLTNLLANAVKFTDEGGDVRVECEASGADVARVRVHDTGRGIPADRLDDIFEPFVQVDRHLTHASQQGVGLGLAISRDLARAMGGDLAVESVVDGGSTFILTLQRVAAPSD